MRELTGGCPHRHEKLTREKMNKEAVARGAAVGVAAGLRQRRRQRRRRGQAPTALRDRTHLRR